MISPESLLSRLSSLRLSPEAKTRIRAELSAYADFHTVTASRAAPRIAPWHAILSGLAMRALAALLVVGTAAGTAAASTGSLPGDVLYPVKVRIAEPVRTALIPSTEGRAAWQATLAERRLEEATKLAVARRLDPETERRLAANFQAHVEETLSASETLAAEGAVEDSLAVRSDLEAKVDAHASILAVVVERLSTSTPEEAPAAEILKVAEEKQVVVEAKRVDAEAKLALAALPAVPDAAVATMAADPAPAAKVEPAPAEVAPTAKIAEASAEREREVAQIIEKHSALLSALPAPVATTTASTTTPATATTTSPAVPGATTTHSAASVVVPPAKAPLNVIQTPLPAALPTPMQKMRLFRAP